MNKDLQAFDDEIKNKIYTIRGLQVMLDEDLAELYKVDTRSLNQAVKRNIYRFPNNFMFQLRTEEFENLISQIVISKRGGRRKLPFAFTEQGVAMLSGVLKSEIAIKISIRIVNTFILMRKLISTNSLIFQKFETVDLKLIEHENKINQVFEIIESKNIKPDQGIFSEGQIFDSHKFISDLIKSAKKSIILIDNYIDESVLTLLLKRKENVSVTIYTKALTKSQILDFTKYDSQYNKIEIKETNSFHDRFLILDEKEVYHIGASLKDLGKKCFAFSKLEKDNLKLFEKLKEINSKK